MVVRIRNQNTRILSRFIVEFHNWSAVFIFYNSLNFFISLSIHRCVVNTYISKRHHWAFYYAYSSSRIRYALLFSDSKESSCSVPSMLTVSNNDSTFFDFESRLVYVLSLWTYWNVSLLRVISLSLMTRVIFTCFLFARIEPHFFYALSLWNDWLAFLLRVIYLEQIESLFFSRYFFEPVELRFFTR